jgi:hypothetical protein
MPSTHIVECACCGARILRVDWESGKYRRDGKPLCPNPVCNGAMYIPSPEPHAVKKEKTA